MTVYLVISLPKIPFIHRTCEWSCPTLRVCGEAARGNVHVKMCVAKRGDMIPKAVVNEAISAGLAGAVHRHRS